MLVSGKVLFANGVPAAGVQVRAFDQDAPGRQDDDLTIEPGLSGNDGMFTVNFDESRFRDFVYITTMEPRNPPWDWNLVPRTRLTPDLTDVYLPYLQFSYSYNGQSRIISRPLVPFVTEFWLPDIFVPPATFQPSLHSFHFDNNFPGYPLPVAVPGLPLLPAVPATYGLCGGMSAAAYDFYLANRSIPADATPPVQGSPLHTYLYQRQVNTFGAYGETIGKFAEWMALPDATLFGTQRRTYDEFEQIRVQLDGGALVLLALVYTNANNKLEEILWENHQVLAYGYSETLTSITIKIYDPNYHQDDNIRLEAQRVLLGSVPIPGPVGIPIRARSVFGLDVTHNVVGKVRGFFWTPYLPIIPPLGL